MFALRVAFRVFVDVVNVVVGCLFVVSCVSFFVVVVVCVLLIYGLFGCFVLCILFRLLCILENAVVVVHFRTCGCCCCCFVVCVVVISLVWLFCCVCYVRVFVHVFNAVVGCLCSSVFCVCECFCCCCVCTCFVCFLYAVVGLLQAMPKTLFCIFQVPFSFSNTGLV